MNDPLVGTKQGGTGERMRSWIGRRVSIHMRDGSRIVGILRDVALALLFIELLEPVRRFGGSSEPHAMAVVNMEHVMFVTGPMM
ncbi:MAG TPA: hypothetical protein VF234_07290 [Limnochordia bacterium]